MSDSQPTPTSPSASIIPDRSGPKFIIEDILPVRQLHLFAGPSGGGKTTLLFQVLEAIQKGEPIFGHKCNKVPFVYVSCDRNVEAVESILDRVKVAHLSFPTLTGVESPFTSPSAVLNAVEKKYPGTRLIIIEGIGFLRDDKVKDMDYAGMGRWLLKIVCECAKRNVTVIGVVHSPKMKDKDRYSNPRQRVHGSVAWAAVSDTIILVEPVDDPEIGNPNRNIFILPRNQPEFQIEMVMDLDGRLVEPDAISGHGWIRAWIAKQPCNKTWRTKDVVEAGKKESVPISERSIKRWLKWSTSTGYAESVGYAEYRSKSIS